MSIEKDTFQLLEPIVAAMNKTFVIDSVTGSASPYILNSCNTLWLTIGYTISIGGNDYVVTDLTANESVTVSGSSTPPTKGSYDIDLPYFTHGTLLMQNAESKLKTDSWDKLPMIYLHETTPERINSDQDDSSIERESDCDLYFMIDCDYANWLTVDHFKYAVRPMRNLAAEFIEALKSSGSVGIIENYQQFDQPNWGIYISNKGQTSRLIDDELSGTQLTITIPFLKDTECEC